MVTSYGCNNTIAESIYGFCEAMGGCDLEPQKLFFKMREMN